MKKRKQVITGLALSMLCLLSACQSASLSKSVAGQSQTTNESNSKMKTNKSTLSASYYPAALSDGKYPLSESRGMLASRTTQANIENLERGLYELMKNTYSSEQYTLREGTLLSEDTLSKWLKPKSDENPEGLNPEASNAKERNQFKPRPLNSILEYNLLQKDNDQYQLKAITIALAMNCEDTFRSDGKEEKVAISREDALQSGKNLAEEVVKRIRQQEEYKKVPVQIALFYNRKSDSMAGGNFMAESVANAGNSLGNWVDYNRQSIVYGVDTPPKEEDNASFTRFRSEIESFFPQLSGLVGVGLYDNKRLIGIDFTINVPFAGYTENIALVQHTIASLEAIYPKDLQMSIKVKSAGHLAATISRGAGQGQFQYVVY